MNTITEAKNELSCCYSKDRLYSTLADLCQQSGFEYDQRASFAKNSRKAREQQQFAIADIIKHAERIESLL